MSKRAYLDSSPSTRPAGQIPPPIPKVPWDAGAHWGDVQESLQLLVAESQEQFQTIIKGLELKEELLLLFADYLIAVGAILEMHPEAADDLRPPMVKLTAGLEKLIPKYAQNES